MDPMLQAQVNSLLTDPTQLQKRNEEIKKVFTLAKLTDEECVLVMDRLNNHRSLEQALAKLQPFISKV